MATIKIIEDVELVYSAETIQGKIELNGEIVEFRYSEDSNGSEHWIFKNDDWETEFDEKYEDIFLACSVKALTKNSLVGEDFDTNNF